MPVQLENIKKLNDDTTQEKPISNSQDKQQRVENIQPTTLTMNTEPIENTSFPQKQNSEFATYTQVKPESFDNKRILIFLFKNERLVLSVHLIELEPQRKQYRLQDF